MKIERRLWYLTAKITIPLGFCVSHEGRRFTGRGFKAWKRSGIKRAVSSEHITKQKKKARKTSNINKWRENLSGKWGQCRPHICYLENQRGITKPRHDFARKMWYGFPVRKGFREKPVSASKTNCPFCHRCRICPFEYGAEGRMPNSEEGEEIASISYKMEIKHSWWPLGERTGNARSRSQDTVSNAIPFLAVSFPKSAQQEARAVLVCRRWTVPD